MKARTVIAVICGVILILSLICCVLIEDEALRIMVAVFGVLYVVYVVTLVRKYRAQPKDKKAKQSPLIRR